MIIVYTQVSMQIIWVEEHLSIAILENLLEKVKEWMALNKSKMNDTKTEAVLSGNLVQL